eukprot:CAMPEP_0172322018 /NCGR_PEP_ID=MMETSP1058-20130122/44804_1 /TAXON_ID=83371 /ORGANISM="Detonula confervacea, Strain CCMP 353" /LENGTH=247 /DNA_ID=CAMNT_0013037649 /DNA_START=40 /DNA_END=780 /DNA_ORIENTATION=+
MKLVLLTSVALMLRGATASESLRGVNVLEERGGGPPSGSGRRNGAPPEESDMPTPAPDDDYHKPTDKSGKCVSFSIDMAYNNLLQEYTNNPDKEATGYGTCTLCTKGPMKCDATVYDGESPLNGSHVHKCKHRGSMGDVEDCGSGDPVINFCGNMKGSRIDDKTKYDRTCKPYMGDPRTSINKGMMGEVVGHGSQEDLVSDIIRNPGDYYLNFHSYASWAYWGGVGKGAPIGMCRGPMVKYGADEVE